MLEAAARARHVKPVGVECFEGVVGERPAVDEVLERVAELAAGRGRAARERSSSAGGSTFFDAAAELARIPGSEVVLRSGCYVVHDDGLYAARSPLAEDPLEPALELWADVLSCPEPGARDRGRRAPRRALRRRPPHRPARLPRRRAGHARLRDRHRAQRPARVRDRRRRLRPGDLLCLGISHPCGAFDRWRTLLEVDADYTVTRAIRTFF